MANSDTTDQRPKHEPWGRGQLCSGKLWVIEPDKECPICGAERDGYCLKDPAYD